MRTAIPPIECILTSTESVPSANEHVNRYILIINLNFVKLCLLIRTEFETIAYVLMIVRSQYVG